MKGKVFFGFFIIALFIAGGLVIYDLKRMDIETLILCSTNEGGILIPESLCNYFMINHRITEDDIENLSRGPSLDYILNLGAPEKYQIAHRFLKKGLDINGVNHYSAKKLTPLHAAVLYNDAERVEFLVENGADLSIKNSYYGMTPLELAEELTGKNEEDSRRKIIEILTASKSGKNEAASYPMDKL